MPIMKTQDGKITASLEKINKIIYPNSIENFPIAAEMEEISKNITFDEALKKQLLAVLPAKLVAEYRKNNLSYFNSFIIRPDINEALQQKLKEYSKPHKNNYDEIHHIMNGAVILGFVTKEDQQVLIILLPGEKIFIPEGSEHWAVMTNDDWVTVISSKSKPPEKQVAQQAGTKILISF